jgi:hypothetical protein
MIKSTTDALVPLSPTRPTSPTSTQRGAAPKMPSTAESDAFMLV